MPVSSCCPRAVGFIVLQLLLLTAEAFTHRCNVSVLGQPGGIRTDLFCTQLVVAHSCNLTVYFNHSISTLSCSPPPFCDGVASLPSPRGSLDVEKKLGRTGQVTYPNNATVQSAMWPLLFFHGGPTCNVELVSLRIENVTMQYVYDKDKGPRESAQVLVFGGGVKATVQGGDVSGSSANFLVAVIANSMLTINGTMFTNNSCLRGPLFSSGNQGGPIYQHKARLIISGAKFSGNKVVEQGGAVFVTKSNMTITRTLFLDNSATDSAGALLAKEHSTVALDKCNFTGNASPKGGAVAAENASLLISGCVFNQNKAQLATSTATDSFWSLGVGGAIQATWSNVQFRNVRLTNNTAGMDGGALYMQLCNTTITKSNLSNNKAFRHGGAIFLGTRDKQGLWHQDTVHKVSALTVYSSVMQDNIAESSGGCLMLQPGAPVHIKNTSFMRCAAWQLGGAVGTETEEQDNRGGKHLQRSSQLYIDAYYSDNQGTGRNMFVGPVFDLQDSQGYMFTDPNKGRVWFRKKCEKGEYIPSQYCELCPAFTYSFTTEGKCIQAPNDTLAPGGAVLVPLSDFWHGNNETFPGCWNCDTLNLSDVKRCPNPEACKHNTKCLADHHPNSRNDKTLSWAQYGSLQCTPGKGYHGILCGTCTKGFGMTSPFSCSRCRGVEWQGHPSKWQISLLYVLYWVILTALSIWAVLSAMALATRGPQLLRNIAFSRPSTLDDVRGRLSTDPVAMDVIKALMVYVQWCMLLVSLPVQWLPWSMSDAAKVGCYPPTSAVSPQSTLSVLYDTVTSIAAGQGASLDCLQQAWGLWQQGNSWDITVGVLVRSVTGAVLVPLVLGASVMLLQLLWHMYLQPAWEAFRSGAAVERGGRRLTPGYMGDLFITTLLVSMYNAYPSIAKVAVGMLMCLQVGAGNERWILDVRLQCPLPSSSRSWLTAPALAVGIVLLVFCVVLPAVIASILFHQAYNGTAMPAGWSHTSPRSNAARLAFRFADYAVDFEVLRLGRRGWASGLHGVLNQLRNHLALAWDSILDYQRLLLAVVALSVTLHALHQLLLVMLVMGAYLLLALLVRPWRSDVVSWLQIGALSVLIASTLGVIACNVGPADATTAYKPSLLYKEVVPVLIIMANGVYVLAAVLCLLHHTYQDFWVNGMPLAAVVLGPS